MPDTTNPGVLAASDAILHTAAEQTTSADQAVVALALSLARACELRGVTPSQAFDAAVMLSHFEDERARERAFAQEPGA